MPSLFARLCIGLLCLSGCGTLPASGVADCSDCAWLRPAVRLQHRVRIVEVDGRELGPFRDRARLAPGPHEVVASASLVVKGRRTRGSHRLSFDAQPGQKYLVHADWYVYGLRMWIEETTSGALVAVAETRPARLPAVGSGPR